MKRKVIITSLSVLGVLLIASVGAWRYFFHTSAGVEFILARLDGIKGMRIVAQEVSGTLAGPLRVKHFELDEKHVHVVADDIELQLTPAALLAQIIRAKYVRVGSSTVTVKAFVDEQSDKPMRFLPTWLHVSVGNLDVKTARVILQNGTVIDATNVVADKEISVSSREVEIENVIATSPYAQVQGNVSILAQKPIGLKGRALAITAVKNPEWKIEVDADGNIDTLQVSARLVAPSAVTFNGALTRVDSIWRLQGDASSELFALNPWLSNPPLSLTHVDLDIDATLQNITAKGVVTIPEFDTLPMNVNATGKVVKEGVFIDQAELRLAKSDAVVNAQVNITRRQDEAHVTKSWIDGKFDWRNLSWPLRNGVVQSPVGKGTLVGSQPYQVHAEADITNNKVATKQKAHVVASGVLSDRAITIEKYTIDALTGSARGKGTLEFAGKRAWSVEANATHINPEFINSAMPGIIDLQLSATGSGFEGDEFAAKIGELHGTLRNQKIRVQGNLGHAADGWFAKAFTAAYGDNRVALDGQFGRVNNLTWQLDVPRIAQIFSGIEGEVHSKGVVHGERAVPQLRGELTAKQLRMGQWHADTLYIKADVDVRRQAESSLQIAAQTIGFDVFILDTMHLVGNGTDVAHQLQLTATAPAEKYESVPTLDWQAHGSYTNKVWRGGFGTIKFSDHYGRTPTLTLPDAVAVLSDGQANVQQWCLNLADKKLCIDGDWNRKTGWRVAMLSDELELNIFDTLLGDKTQLEGRWQLSGKVIANNDAPPIGDAHLRIADAVVLYEAVENAQERVQIGTGRVDVNATTQQLDGSLGFAMRGTTKIDAGLQINRLPDIPLTQAPLTGSLQATTSDANVLPLFFADLDHAAGSLQANLNANGSLANPLFRGRIQLQNGELDLYRYNLAMRSMGATMDIADNRIDFNASSRLGQGTLNAQGQLLWQDSKAKGSLRLQGADLLVADLPEYRVVASPNLLFSIDGKRIDASGDVVIPSAHLQPVDLRGAVQRSPDARLVGMQPADEQAEYEVHSDINVRLGDDVQLNTFGLQGKLVGAVNTSTDPGEPATGKGELRVQSGRYQAYGQDLEIERGRLLFESSPLDNPGLDILAIRRIEEQKVGVNVRGTLRVPRLSFYSDPSLTQSQTVAYLLTGKAIEDMRTQDAAAVGNESNALALQGGGLLASQLGRRIGLEAVSVESKGLNDTSLVLGKFLSPRLFVSYGISLTESINTLKARYSLSDRWLLKVESGQNQSGDVEFRIER